MLLDFLYEHLPFRLSWASMHTLALTTSIHAQNSYHTVMYILSQHCLLSYRYNQKLMLVLKHSNTTSFHNYQKLKHIYMHI